MCLCLYVGVNFPLPVSHIPGSFAVGASRCTRATAVYLLVFLFEHSSIWLQNCWCVAGVQVKCSYTQPHGIYNRV